MKFSASSANQAAEQWKVTRWLKGLKAEHAWLNADCRVGLELSSFITVQHDGGLFGDVVATSHAVCHDITVSIPCRSLRWMRWQPIPMQRNQKTPWIWFDQCSHHLFLALRTQPRSPLKCKINRVNLRGGHCMQFVQTSWGINFSEPKQSKQSNFRVFHPLVRNPSDIADWRTRGGKYHSVAALLAPWQSLKLKVNIYMKNKGAP